VRDAYKKAILVITSGVIAAVGGFALTETVLSLQYAQWKIKFNKGIELSSRLTVASQNPMLIWEYRPNTVSHYRGMFLHTNRYGFRDRDYEVPSRPAGVYRVAFVGDSVTVGLFVDDHETFVRKFEDYGHLLNPSLQALNFGIDGYNPDQIYELLRSRVMQFEPNKVVYVMCLNDFDLTDASGEKIRYYRKPHSFVIEELRALFTPRLTWDARDSEAINNNVKYHIWHYKKNRMHVFDKIREMRDFLHAKAISFEVVVVPVFRFSISNEFTNYPFMTMHHQIDDILGDNKIDFLDLINAFSQQSRPGTLLSTDVWHPNPAGHDFIAEQLVKGLSLSKSLRVVDH
jgi:lysophospholipase L1-like esterase